MREKDHSTKLQSLQLTANWLLSKACHCVLEVNQVEEMATKEKEDCNMGHGGSRKIALVHVHTSVIIATKSRQSIVRVHCACSQS